MSARSGGPGCARCTHREVELRSSRHELRRVARAANRNEDPTKREYFRDLIAAKKAEVKKHQAWLEEHESECEALNGVPPVRASS
jgi:hypothetical protein